MRFESQRIVPIIYKGITLPSCYRIDLIVEELIVVEVKAIERLLTVHEAQLLTYLRLVNSPAGLLMNFNVAKLTDGVKRLINPRYKAATHALRRSPRRGSFLNDRHGGGVSNAPRITLRPVHRLNSRS